MRRQGVLLWKLGVLKSPLSRIRGVLDPGYGTRQYDEAMSQDDDHEGSK